MERYIGLNEFSWIVWNEDTNFSDMLEFLGDAFIFSNGTTLTLNVNGNYVECQHGHVVIKSIFGLQLCSQEYFDIIKKQFIKI